MSIYEQLYDVVKENYVAAGSNFTYQKTTFLCEVGSNAKVIDVSRYTHLSNEAFFQAIFASAYKRLPEAKEEAVWQTRYTLPAADFQQKVLRHVVNSSVVAINQIRFVNNPYFEQKVGLRQICMGKLYGLTDKASLRSFGKKLPQPIQKIIRKVFL